MKTTVEFEDLFTMSNLPGRLTGLPFVVWISPKGGARHDVRVKVSTGPRAKPGEFITVGVRPAVQVIEGDISAEHLALLTRWIERNREVLVRFWDGDLEYTTDVLEQLQSI
jgi:hypothetical protein